MEWRDEERRRGEERVLTGGTELMLICCGWFMGEAARAAMGACVICTFCLDQNVELGNATSTRAHTHRYTHTREPNGTLH